MVLIARPILRIYIGIVKKYSGLRLSPRALGYTQRHPTTRREGMTMAASVYDLAVIGSGPAGQKAAVAGAKLGRRVVVVDRRDMIGGVCIHTRTIPRKALREAIPYLSCLRQR